MKTFGKILREKRKEYGISQTDLANSIGLQRGTIALYELEDCAPSLFVALKCARFLGFDLMNLKAGLGPKVLQIEEKEERIKQLLERTKLLKVES